MIQSNLWNVRDERIMSEGSQESDKEHSCQGGLALAVDLQI